jgi:hypothetical protein
MKMKKGRYYCRVDRLIEEDNHEEQPDLRQSAVCGVGGMIFSVNGV